MFRRGVRIALFVVLIRVMLWPCSLVTVGPEAGKWPSTYTVTSVKGKVVGSSSVELMGAAHDNERQNRPVPSATVTLSARTDVPYRSDCSGTVARTLTDDGGHFILSRTKPGKYCLELSAPTMTGHFLIDVVDSKDETTLVADISPLWPDCSGGNSIKVLRNSN